MSLVDAIEGIILAEAPAGFDAAYFRDFYARYRPAIEDMLYRSLPELAPASAPQDDIPEFWTASKRVAANLAAMATAKRLLDAGRHATRDERAIVAGYSGWGGLSITGAAAKFPAGFPVPDERGLIHEFYTPTKVCREVARVIAPLVPGLPRQGEYVQALEPSVGIGRFLRAFEHVPGLNWHAVEYSELSYTMLRILYPDLDLELAPFERWVFEHAGSLGGKLGLVVSNPPYGARGASLAEDPDRTYREKMAYPYFLRRGLDLLAPDGLGVFLVPGGFMTSRTEQFKTLRAKVLLRHHLAAAYRLPSIGANGREAIFPGAMLVTDLLFFRARDGALETVDPADAEIMEGNYYKDYPRHILGREIGDDHGEDDQGKKPRWGYGVQGDFTKLPDLVERPICSACRLLPISRAGETGRAGVSRTAGDDVTNLSRDLSGAVLLGTRVDRYLALRASEASEDPAFLWRELVDGLTAWASVNGNPHAHVELVKLARGGNTGAERFLSAFDRAGDLIPGLATPPPKIEPRYNGRTDDIPALADHLYRQYRQLSEAALYDYYRGLGGKMAREAVETAILAAGWCLDGDGWNELVPASVYLTGSLWPKMDRAMAHTTPQAKAQSGRLLGAISPAIFDDLLGWAGAMSPRQGWVPLDLVNGWVNATFAGYDDVEFERKGGLTQPKGLGDYGSIERGDRTGFHPEILLITGWMNHDGTLFRPAKPGKYSGATDDEKDLDKIRAAKALEWETSFKGWVGADPERQITVTHAYNRKFRGYIQPVYTSEPLHLARWTPGKGSTPASELEPGVKPIVLNPHQVAGARRILANRGGLLAFDVGVGKTYTGLAVLARARQEGWCKRPVVLVPNSIVWKWKKDFATALPDYRVAVIGSKRKTLTRGPRKGYETSETDTPSERAEKWTRFQAGEYDAVLLTYEGLSRTRMNEKAVREYADHTQAIAREIKLRQRSAGKRKKLSERDEAILKEGVGAWVAEQMELPENQQYDPGIAWDDIGIDMLIVDEGQNFKNLYLPEPREGGVPKFMGSAGEGAKRAWQLDFRAAQIRKKNGGTGIVILSATPAKNSPLEFYNILQYVDPESWRRAGINDPEQFIDRYCVIEQKEVMTPTLEVEMRPACVGFQNLAELRDILFRYADFKTAEEVGIELPAAQVGDAGHPGPIWVDMDARQDAKYDRFIREIEAALKSDDPTVKVKILGLMARMQMVTIHADMDEGFDWGNAAQVSDPHSPKFDALAERVMASRDCGHIVFIENVAAHVWIKQVLIEAGMAPDRIGILNAKSTPNAADRLRVAESFNGNPDEDLPAALDVVIANQVAYEGIDLQTRTCAIHHMDLPWEPATLQQRNGRGFRQGNVLSAIALYYYFANRSSDGLRFNMIQEKRAWMVSLLKSQDRETNNPGAQMEMSAADILVLISRNPEQTKARMAALRAQREAEAKAKIAAEASKLLRAINGRFRNAERTRDPVEGARLRGEAEARMVHLATTNVEAWPWAEEAKVVREKPILVIDGGGPLYEGLYAAIPSAWSSKMEYIEFGKVTKDGQVALRAAGEGLWRLAKGDDAKFKALKPDHYHATMPGDEAEFTKNAIVALANDRLRYSGDWPGLGWSNAPDSWVVRTWPMVADVVIGALAKVSYYNAQSQSIPVMAPAGMRIVNAQQATMALSVFAPTEDGWHAFLGAAPASGLKWGELAAAGTWWWGRRIPRGLLTGEAEEAEGETTGALGLPVSRAAMRILGPEEESFLHEAYIAGKNSARTGLATTARGLLAWLEDDPEELDRVVAQARRDFSGAALDAFRRLKEAFDATVGDPDLQPDRDEVRAWLRQASRLDRDRGDRGATEDEQRPTWAELRTMALDHIAMEGGSEEVDDPVAYMDDVFGPNWWRRHAERSGSQTDTRDAKMLDVVQAAIHRALAAHQG